MSCIFSNFQGYLGIKCIQFPRPLRKFSHSVAFLVTPFPPPYTHDVIFEYTFRPKIMELLEILVMNILLGNCQKLKKTKKILVNINKTIIYNNYIQKLIYCMHNKN